MNEKIAIKNSPLILSLQNESACFKMQA